MKKSNLFITIGIVLFICIILYILLFSIVNGIVKKSDLVVSEFNFDSNINKIILGSDASYEIFSSDENKVLVYFKNKVEDSEISFKNNEATFKLNSETFRSNLYIEVYSKDLKAIENQSNSYVSFKNAINKENEDLLIRSNKYLLLDLNAGQLKSLNIVNYGYMSISSLDLKISTLNFNSSGYSLINLKKAKINDSDLTLYGNNTINMNMQDGVLSGGALGGKNKVYIKGTLKSNDFLENEYVSLKIS